MAGNRSRRKILILGGLALVACGVAGGLIYSAMSENVVFFYSPSQVAAGEAPKGRAFRVGGMVKTGTVKISPDGMATTFVVTDDSHDVACSYKGALPDLFAENTGVVAQGRLGESGIFVASEVLAKHDENYMPPEAAKAMEDAKKARAAAAPR
ncbi:cytochrome c maturation protein CcmE [Mesosutterella sp. OilRF-GAM-744-9]|uniref:Cytochrome c-type biogenesis protein CcmE n=1 Tax=Mesosutterella porci TaxID=2915351 RepID=A0ABS9MS32_9BURK|nr:cytochrome c maturation protein CcmE [Mesosutterella sp. oilRF-744-WT-GAM-9]MCG5031431.1 cytochrome c maturation protein CcmE [Mesosutterella sp. oilRF-744-WT-GAM-9]